MGEVVNLRRARKARLRAVDETAAAENRALHGRTKGEQTAEALEEARREQLLDGAKRED